MSPQGADPPPPSATRGKAGRNNLNEEITPHIIGLPRNVTSLYSYFLGPDQNNPDVMLGWVGFVHRKKRFKSFPSPAGMSLTKLPLGRNNSVLTSLFPPRESLVVTSRLGTKNSRTFFLRCSMFSTRIFLMGMSQIQEILYDEDCLNQRDVSGQDHRIHASFYDLHVWVRSYRQMP
jgi:hypothetical protein